MARREFRRKCSGILLSIRNQQNQLRSYAQKQEWEIVAEYVDQVSGKTGDRPQFKAMMKAASMREFDLVLFWSLDRLSREGALETLQYLQTLTSYGEGWKSSPSSISIAAAYSGTLC